MEAQKIEPKRVCPVCHCILSPKDEPHYGIFTVEDHNREYLLRHCPACGSLVIEALPLVAVG